MATSAYIITAAIVVISLLFVPSIRDKSRPHRLGRDPGLFNIKTWLARVDFLRNGPKLIERGYREVDITVDPFEISAHVSVTSQNKDTNYVVQTLLGDQVVLSPKFLPELRMLPESSLNATAALVDSVLGSYSGVDILLHGHLSTDVCRGTFTRNLHNILPQMIDEVNLAKTDLLGVHEKGHSASHVAYNLIYSLISRISSRAFVGAPICYDNIWTEAVNRFPMDVEKVKFALLLLPSSARSWIVPLLPQKWRLTRDHQKVRDLLFPGMQLKKPEEDFTFLNFLLQTSKDTDPETLTSRMILMTAAAFHNSSMATVQAVYSLCAMPEYVPALRSEAQSILQDIEGDWTVEQLNKLHRLDSFLKESQRMNASSFLGFDRKVMSTVKLSDGTVLLPGDTIAMPLGPITRDEAYYADAKKFDGYRFYYARAKANEDEGRSENEYSEIEPGNLSWGHGRFSCPGRWYASLMIKLLLASLILEYDFGFPEGTTTPPSDFVMDVHVLPDMKQKIILTKI